MPRLPPTHSPANYMPTMETFGITHQTKRPLHREKPKGHCMNLPKLVFKVTIRISHNSFLSLSINNNSSKAVIICHFRPRDDIKFKSKSNGTGHRNKDASQDQKHQIHSALSYLSISWKNLLTNASPVNTAQCSECWML